MIRSALATAFLLFLALALRRIYVDVLGMAGLPSPVSLGFILVASHTFSRLFVPLRIPRICAYMVMGMLCGPFALKLISQQGVAELRLIERIAIALIALTAGGEIRWALVRRQYRTLLALTCVLVAVLLVGTTAGFVAAAPFIGFLKGAPATVVIAGAILMGVTAVAKSPSTAVAVIKEAGGRGRLGETVLTVLLLLDAIAVVLFALSLAIADGLLGQDGAIGLGAMFALSWHIAGALPIGATIGLLAGLYLRFSRGNYLLFVFLLCLLLVEIATTFAIELIMMAAVAGFAVENFSRRGEDLMRAIDSSDLPVYVAFFTLAGASVNFTFLATNWGLSLFFIALIGALTWFGCHVGARIGRLEKPYRDYAFMGLIAQAGLNLSFASLIRDHLTLSLAGGITLGEGLQTLIVARVAVKQLVGPVLFRFALDRVGEVGSADNGGPSETT